MCIHVWSLGPAKLMIKYILCLHFSAYLIKCCLSVLLMNFFQRQFLKYLFLKNNTLFQIFVSLWSCFRICFPWDSIPVQKMLALLTKILVPVGRMSQCCSGNYVKIDVLIKVMEAGKLELPARDLTKIKPLNIAEWSGERLRSFNN